LYLPPSPKIFVDRVSEKLDERVEAEAASLLRQLKSRIGLPGSVTHSRHHINGYDNYIVYDVVE
jgi:hypothetical protein